MRCLRQRRRDLADVVLVAVLAGCASRSSPVVHAPGPPVESDTVPVPPPPPAPSPAEKAAAHDAEADKKAMAVALGLGLATVDVQWAPSRRLFALAPRAGGKSRLMIFADNGERLSDFEVPGNAAPTDLAFLGDALVAYQASAPARPTPPARGARPAAKARKPRKGAPRPVWVVQPTSPASPSRICDAARAVFSKDRRHLAHVEPTEAGEWVGVDGVQVWPRHGRSTIQGPPAWSDDARSLALVETPEKADPRLVVLVETDNPSGDTTWPLPPTARDPALRVFWAGGGVVTVGESATKPSFSASFQREDRKGGGGRSAP